MLTRILIARHGNTFTKEQIPTRVGRCTDLPLVEETLSRNLGKYLKNQGLLPVVVFAAPLQRTMQTAQLAIAEMHNSAKLIANEQFLELDYGPDENKTEAEVQLRLGKAQVIKHGESPDHYQPEELQSKGAKIIAAWNKKAIVPDGWLVDPQQLINNWLSFATMVTTNYQNQTILVISSNGIIRFAPYLTADFDKFIATYNIKVATGNLCIFEKSTVDQHWHCKEWNINPTQQLITRTPL